MAPCIHIILPIALGVVTASTLCQDEFGFMSDGCLDDKDESASFLQMSKHAATGGGRIGPSVAVSKLRRNQTTTNVTKITPVDCDKLNKPLQITRAADQQGYEIKELNISTGNYTVKFEVDWDAVPGNFSNIGGCGINPLDSILYCAMFAGGSYIVRLDKVDGTVEFVARLPWFKPYNSGDFAPDGTFFVGTYYAEYLAVKNLHKQKGCPAKDKNCKDIMDLRSEKRKKPKGFRTSADCIAVTADLQGNGVQTYLMVMMAKTLYIARYDNETDSFPESWKMGITPHRGDYIYGAGWNFQNQIFFAVNNGKGVYQIPLENWTKDTLNESVNNSDFRLKLTKVGKSEPAKSNDGLSCITDPNPWVTQMQSFDCKEYPGPLQAVVNGSGYDLTTVDFDTGDTEVIYRIPMSRTTPAFRMMNAFSICPIDSIVYAAVQLDSYDGLEWPTPPPFYVVRVDQDRVEFVAKVQASRGRPIAGSFDPAGNLYIVSNPSLIKIPVPAEMMGYESHEDEDLPFFDVNSSAILIDKMKDTNQMADIVAVPANFDDKGEATWVVGVNTHEQVLAVKVEDKAEHYVVRATEVIGQVDRQNFGAAWYLNGEVFVGSNDGVGVFKVPLDKIKVPDGPTVELEKVGKSPKNHDNDGLNCIESKSVFWGRTVKFD